MTKEDIIRMADEAKLIAVMEMFEDEVVRFAALVAAAEREASAKLCDGWLQADGDRCAEAIRARSSNE
jgi:hypothetical protein